MRGDPTLVVEAAACAGIAAVAAYLSAGSRMIVDASA